MQESTPICPYCKNQAYFDSKTSSSYCKSKLCQGAVIEQGKITYENEVNLHETDDQTKKQTRFGGYENKREAFKNKLCEMLGKNDSRQRKQFYEKFESGEHLIHTLSSTFRQNESFTNDVIQKYRALIFEHAIEMQSKSFPALAAISYHLTVQERKNQLNMRNSKQNDSILSKINIEQITKFSNVTPQQIDQVSKVVNLKGQNSSRADVIEQIIAAIQNQHKLPFSEEELQAARDIPESLMKNAIIKGEKTSTITCVIELMICQLSSNPELNKKSLEEFTSLNDVTKDTVKKLWNTIIDNQSLNAYISEWRGKKPNSELKHLQ